MVLLVFLCQSPLIITLINWNKWYFFLKIREYLSWNNYLGDSIVKHVLNLIRNYSETFFSNYAKYCIQLKYHQYVVRCEIYISLEIILHLFKYLIACSAKILTSREALVISFSVDVLLKTTSSAFWEECKMYISGNTFIKNIELFVCYLLIHNAKSR